jgi:hypothetical protein
MNAFLLILSLRACRSRASSRDLRRCTLVRMSMVLVHLPDAGTGVSRALPRTCREPGRTRTR